MTKQELITAFIENHQQAVQYINRLEDRSFNYRYLDKWTAGQQLEHLLLTIIPFTKALSSKTFIMEKFGTIGRTVWDYETVLVNYSKSSLKAPDQFLPKEDFQSYHKGIITSEIMKHLDTIGGLLNTYSEEELDTLVLPHPLLGRLTIREMFYLMSYHPLHHQRQIENILELNFR